jgi:hypothetical protein
VAIGNREAYADVQEKTFDILATLRELVLSDDLTTRTSTSSQTRSAIPQQTRQPQQTNNATATATSTAPTGEKVVADAAAAKAAAEADRRAVAAARKTEREQQEYERLFKMWEDTFGKPEEVIQKLRETGVDIPEPIVVDMSLDSSKQWYRYNTDWADGQVGDLVKMWADSFPVDATGKPDLSGWSNAMKKRGDELAVKYAAEQKKQWEVENSKRKPAISKA